MHISNFDTYVQIAFQKTKPVWLPSTKCQGACFPTLLPTTGYYKPF